MKKEFWILEFNDVPAYFCDGVVSFCDKWFRCSLSEPVGENLSRTGPELFMEFVKNSYMKTIEMPSNKIKLIRYDILGEEMENRIFNNCKVIEASLETEKYFLLSVRIESQK